MKQPVKLKILIKFKFFYIDETKNNESYNPEISATTKGKTGTNPNKTKEVKITKPFLIGDSSNNNFFKK